MASAVFAVSCRCATNHGFTQHGDWWICAGCRLPKHLYLASVLNDPTAHGMENSDMGLVYFDGGPLDGQAYETKTLLGTNALQLPVHQYVWTNEKKVSERTGSSAQIWRFKDGAQPMPPRATTDDPNPARRALAEVTADEPVPVDLEVTSAKEGDLTIENAKEGDLTVSSRVVTNVTPPYVDMNTSTVVTGTDPEEAVLGVGTPVADSGPDMADVAGEPGPEEPEPASQPVATPEQSTGQSSDAGGARPDLAARRKAVKASVAALSAASGLAGSKVGAIEKGIGKRVKDEEIAQYIKGLEELERQAGVS